MSICSGGKGDYAIAWTVGFLTSFVAVIVQSLSCGRLFVTPWTTTCQASLSFTISQSLLKLMSIESVMPSNHLILCHPVLLLSSAFPSIRVFSNELVLCIKWPKNWSFSFSISPSNEYSGMIFFRTDWFDLLVFQGTLKGLLQWHSSKASILQCSAFFMVQLSHPYMTTGKTIALTIWTFIIKVMSLLCHSFSSKEQASFNFIAAVTICSDFGAQENKMSLFPIFPHLFAMKGWDWMPRSSFFECYKPSFLSQLFHSPLSPSLRGSFSLFSTI